VATRPALPNRPPWDRGRLARPARQGRRPPHPGVQAPSVVVPVRTRAWRRERARRRARLEHRREQRVAGVRFLVLIGVLLFVTLFLSLSIWEKIGSLFGL